MSDKHVHTAELIEAKTRFRETMQAHNARVVRMARQMQPPAARAILQDVVQKSFALGQEHGRIERLQAEGRQYMGQTCPHCSHPPALTLAPRHEPTEECGGCRQWRCACTCLAMRAASPGMAMAGWSAAAHSDDRGAGLPDVDVLDGEGEPTKGPGVGLQELAERLHLATMDSIAKAVETSKNPPPV